MGKISGRDKEYPERAQDIRHVIIAGLTAVAGICVAMASDRKYMAASKVVGTAYDTFESYICGKYKLTKATI